LRRGCQGQKAQHESQPASSANSYVREHGNSLERKRRSTAPTLLRPSTSATLAPHPFP
jgi:hypothetical protein